MIALDDPTSLSLLFHLNSEPWLNDDAYKSAATNQEFKRPEEILAEAVLPTPAPSVLAELWRARRSCRAFETRAMPIGHVASLLAAAYGVVGAPPDPDPMPFLRRTVPSAGGLFPLEVYVIARRIDGVPDGLYHYDIIGHALQLMKRGDAFPSLEPLFYTYPFIAGANLVLAIAAVFKRTQNKYGPRGYRYILLEAGHAGQNVCLRAAELGVATLCMGGFVDSGLNALLGLRPEREGAVYTIAAGYAAGAGA